MNKYYRQPHTCYSYVPFLANEQLVWEDERQLVVVPVELEPDADAGVDVVRCVDPELSHGTRHEDGRGEEPAL